VAPADPPNTQEDGLQLEPATLPPTLQDSARPENADAAPETAESFEYEKLPELAVVAE